ncbi:MAG: UDP-N-acetylmuramoyl-tripeptide--D-alanyl-D-alanine ligase [Candidatus Buchananbacteria bacterium]|nr:UDP-N-acetylmuramoyl-tripeptide--D-alanyl-D-alanine ligase [Candidatus Buchananbacteria bacterium]
MKPITKKLLIKILQLITRGIRRRYQPEIIGITGSVGKTSAKEAVYTVLNQRFNVRRNSKNYNNEIGLPLTFIGAESAGRSVIGWLRIFLLAVKLLVWRRDRNYPKILILEMGTDRPGDMQYLTNLAPCKIGIVTNVGTAHIEYFKTSEKIAKEKSVIVSHLSKNGWAIVNADNEYTAPMTTQTRARTLTFGVEHEADMMAIDIRLSRDRQQLPGLSFKLQYHGSTVPVLLPRVIGSHLVYAALVGASVGIVYGLNLVEIAQALRSFQLTPGRMSLIDGIKGTLIIDDTYNAGPDSMQAALETASKLKRRGVTYAVLGDMLELGDMTESAHEAVGAAVVHNKFDVLITVGERAKTIARVAREKGMSEDAVFTFADVGRAGRFLQDRLEPQDLVLVKGSRGMRMEKIVKEVMAEPLRADELLVSYR